MILVVLGARTRRAACMLATMAFALLLLAASAHAAFPGKNGKIAFTSNRDGNNEIYVMNGDGSGQTRITNNSFGDSEPAWSPDGTRIAFTSDRDPSDPNCDGFFLPCNSEIYVMNADGSGQTRLTNSTFVAELQPTWTPDGKRISFTKWEGCSNDGCLFSVFSINADGTGGGGLFDSNLGETTDPAWSPDGTRLAFSGTDLHAGRGLYTARADGTDRQLFQSGGGHADWSPDQRAIVFDIYDDIERKNLDGTGFAVLRSSDSFEPDWSPDGTKIAFVSTGDGNLEIHLMNADGTGEVRLTNNSASDLDPDWQTIVGPQRSDYKNAAQFCNADRDFLGDEGFRKKYGANGNGANAHGKCVSQN